MLPIDRTAKAAMDTNLSNGILSDAPKIKANNDVVYNTIDELNSKVDGMVTSGTLSPIPPDFMYRQGIINGNFDLWYRGTTFNNPSSNSYTAERFYVVNNIDANVKILQSASVPNKKSKYSLRMEVMTATAGANAVTDLIQKVEDFVYFSGQEVAFYGFVKCDSGASFTPILSDGVGTLTGSTINASGWTFFSITTTINVSPTELRLILRFNRGGLATGVGINISQIGLNCGNVAYPFQPKSSAEDVLMCQRFHQRLGGTSYFIFGFARAYSTTAAYVHIPLKGKMRITPSLTYSGIIALSGNNAVNISIDPLQSNGDMVTLIVEVSGGLVVGNIYLLQANLDATAYLDFDAEP